MFRCYVQIGRCFNLQFGIVLDVILGKESKTLYTQVFNFRLLDNFIILYFSIASFSLIFNGDLFIRNFNYGKESDIRARANSKFLFRLKF